MRVSVQNGSFILTFRFNRAILDIVRSMEKRRWDSTTKRWVVEVTDKNIGILEGEVFSKFKFSPEAENIISEKKKVFSKRKEQEKETQALSSKTDAKIKIKGLGGKLRNFQKAGVAFIDRLNGNCLIADEMGLGKTIQALAWLQLRKKKRPVLIVCPATLKLNWEKEIRVWLPKSNPLVLYGEDEGWLGDVDTNKHDIIIINYDILKRLGIKVKFARDDNGNILRNRKNKPVEIYKAKKFFRKFKVVILDESTNIKNEKSQRTKAVVALSQTKRMKHIMALSGTPFLNRPIEMFTTLSLIAHEEFGNYMDYAFKYCGAKNNGFGWNFKGASNTEELAERLRSTVMIRRLKRDVLSELPDKQRSALLQKVNLKSYKRVEADLVAYLMEEKGVKKEKAEKTAIVAQLAKIEYCKQEAVKAKIPLFVDWVHEFLEDSDEKLIIFIHHKETTKELKKALKSYKPLTITGGDKTKDRNESVELFQNDDEHRIIICSIKAASMGLTLTRASNVAFLELGWTPGEHAQAEDRAHRIGQKQCVNAYYFLAKGTIDEIIYDLLEEKRVVFEKVMSDGGEALAFTTEGTKAKKKKKNQGETSIASDLIKRMVRRGGKKNEQK